MAAVIKVGGWASHVVVPVRSLIAVPDGVTAVQAETVLVNGVTAWQMLFREAASKAGQTILVHGANGGVGTVLCQLGRHFGMQVIGTASPLHRDALRAMGIEPVDYNAPNLLEQIRTLAPDGVDAAFDHLGRESARMSYRLLHRSGSLVVYGNAAALGQNTSIARVFLSLIGQLLLWKLRPRGHSVTFYNFWAGRLLRPSEFRNRLKQDLAALFELLQTGAIDPTVAATFPLAEVGAAMSLADRVPCKARSSSFPNATVPEPEAHHNRNRRKDMRFVVLGATGRTGRQVVERALQRGHSVTAVVRGASMKEAEGLRVVVADPCDPEDLLTILAGQNAVISCLGQRPGGSPWFVRDAAKAMLEAMQKAKVRRYVLVSGALLFPSLNPLVLLLKRVMANKLEDARATENLICATDLNWTIVRPPHLREGTASKGYRIDADPRPRLTWSLQFLDLADSLLDLAEGDRFTRQVIGVASH